MLKLAKNLSLPVDFVTERIAFLARTGAGKSGGARVIFEQALANNIFTVFVDPKGDAWGIRAAGIGKGKPVLILGGDHGDLPLDPSAGKFTAEFLNRERVSTVLDISDFQTKDMWRFMADFGMTFYKKNREVVLVILDEADMIAGEKFYDPHTLHAIQLIQNKGRHRGFGVIVISQRSAILNKSVLYACGTLISMQTTAPKDIKVVQDYFDVSGSKEAAKEIVSNLPTLQNREAFVYSPHVLGSDPVRITFDTFQTFDSMRTPKPGETRQVPKSLADIDLSVVQKDMAATIEKVNAEDPAKLQARIRELERQVAKPISTPVEKIVEKEIEILPKGLYIAVASRLETIEKTLGDIVISTQRRIETVKEQVEGISHFFEQASVENMRKTQPTVSRHIPQPHITDDMQRVIDAANPKKGTVGSMVEWFDGQAPSLPEGEKKILIAMAQVSGGTSRENIGILTGYKRSTRDEYIKRLAAKGLAYSENGLVQATELGIAALGSDYEPLPTGAELVKYWVQKLPEGESKILLVTIDAYPRTVDRETIGNITNYKRSTRDEYIKRLKVRKLVTTEARGVRASANLF